MTGPDAVVALMLVGFDYNEAFELAAVPDRVGLAFDLVADYAETMVAGFVH
jgi:hypothetical protein